MSNTITSARSLRVENETPLSGSEAQEVDGHDDLDIEVAAAGAWPGVDVGLAAIKAMRAQAICLHSDQDVEALFLGPAYNILATTAIAAGADATVTFTGDLTDIIFPGDIILIEGTVANNGLYMVRNEPGAYPAVDILSVALAAGDTTIMIANGTDLAPAGAVGTFRKVMSLQHHVPRYDIALGALNVGAPGNIVWPGDLTEQFAVGDYFAITHGTNPGALPGHDGLYLIETIVFAAGNTTITIPLAQAFLEATADGLFHRVRPAIKLTANVPMLWTVEGGTNNPFQELTTWTALQGDLAQLRIVNTGATAANFNLRIARNVELP